MRLRTVGFLAPFAFGLLTAPLVVAAQQPDKAQAWILWEEQTVVFTAILALPDSKWNIADSFETKPECDGKRETILLGASLLAARGKWTEKNVEFQVTVKDDRYTEVRTVRDQADPTKSAMWIDIRRLLCLPASVDPRPRK